MLPGFLPVSRREMAFEIPEIFYAFGPQRNASMSAGGLLKYFRRRLLQFEWSKKVPNALFFSSAFGHLQK